MSDPHRRLLVSTKALLHCNGRVLLLKNEREEWDLPGGKLQGDETLEQCLARELIEELGVSIEASRVLDAFKHHYHDNIMVIVYEGSCDAEFEPVLSDEHAEAGWFSVKEISTMNVPGVYQEVIAKGAG